MLSLLKIISFCVLLLSIKHSTSFNGLVRIFSKTHTNSRNRNCCNHITSLTPLTRLQSTVDAKDKEAVTIKLPIIQIFKTNAITGEFVCGNEMGPTIDKFQLTLKSLEKDSQISESNGNYGVSNIYSEDQLENILTSTKDYVVLKLFRVGCKKCESLEPIFDELSRDPVYSRFQFLQADVAYVETYKMKLKERLTAMRIGQTETTSS